LYRLGELIHIGKIENDEIRSHGLEREGVEEALSLIAGLVFAEADGNLDVCPLVLSATD